MSTRLIACAIEKEKRATTMPDEPRIRLSNRQEPQNHQSPESGMPTMTRYSNPQSSMLGASQAPRPRRAGQGQLYRQYVPAQGDEPPQLRHTPGEWQQPLGTELATDANEKVPTQRRRQRTLVTVFGIIAVIAVALGGAVVLRTLIHPEEEAGASTNAEEQSSFDTSADNATDFLVANKTATSKDMEMLTMLFPALGDEYETLSQRDPSVMNPDKVVEQVSVGGWGDGIRGWSHLQLRVRASEYALDTMKKQYGSSYEVVSVSVPDESGGTHTPSSVSLVCRCTEGENEGLTLDVTVGLTGGVPQVMANMDAAVSKKMGVLDRLNAVIDAVPGLYVGDFALEGYTTPLAKEDGTIKRTESWWLYVNSNVAPTDIDEFVTFVNTLHGAFQGTAESDVVNIDLTVISCDATDPAMNGRSFSELATELAVTNDPGGLYMEFDYPLRGQASTTTPCRKEDLDGRLHPYEWS